MKHCGKLYVAAAAGFMALSTLSASPVFAEEETPKAGVITGNTVEITKKLTLTDGVKPASAVKFAYTVTPATGLTVPDGGLAADTVFNGVAGGLTASDATTHGTVADNVMPITGAVLTANASRFTYPGIYQYTLTETAHEATTNAEYEDITNDSTIYVVKVYVAYNAAGKLEVTHLEISKGNQKTS